MIVRAWAAAQVITDGRLWANLGTTRYDRGFDQNRVFGGISRTVNAKVRFGHDCAQLLTCNLTARGGEMAG